MVSGAGLIPALLGAALRAACLGPEGSAGHRGVARPFYCARFVPALLIKIFYVIAFLMNKIETDRFGVPQYAGDPELYEEYTERAWGGRDGPVLYRLLLAPSLAQELRIDAAVHREA